MAETIQLQIYQILGRILSPAVSTLWSKNEHLQQRLGHASLERPPGLLIWIHGVSLGESLAALPLAEHVLKALPSAHVLMTTVTQAGMDLLQRRKPERAICQDTHEAIRLQILGASASQIRFAGDLKYASAGYAVTPPGPDEPIRAASGRPVWIAASTHEGEEEVVCSVHLQLSLALPALLTVLAPRHPLRAAAIAAMLQRAGLTVARRSAGEPVTSEVAVYLVDTLGELGALYTLAPVAFVGGSLFPHLSGHNLAEPAASGCALLTGPYVGHFQGMVRELGGAVQQVADAEELSSAVRMLLSNTLVLKSQRIASREAFHRNSALTIERVWASIARPLFGPETRTPPVFQSTTGG